MTPATQPRRHEAVTILVLLAIAIGTLAAAAGVAWWALETFVDSSTYLITSIFFSILLGLVSGHGMWLWVRARRGW